MGVVKAFRALAVAAVLAAPAAQAQDSKVIGVSIPAATHGWAGGMNYHAQEAVKRLEKTYPQLKFVLATAGDPAKQVSDIEDMMATRNIDALVVLPFESAPLTGPVKRVAEAGKWVTVVDRGLAEEGIEDLYVAGDNPGFGRVAGEFFRERLPNGGKIVVLRGIPTTIDNERVEAFQKAIEGSGIEIIGMEHGNWNRDNAFTVMQDFLSKHPKIDAVWASDDDMAVGVLEAINQAGRQDEMWVLGGAGMKEMIKRVMDGDTRVPANVTYPPSMIATAIEITALRFVSNAPVSGRFVIGSELITKDNAKDFYFPDSPF
ncbi:ABC transporter substrate-binding protein [Chelatococcus composti]|jgi:ABC-type sugar transport system, periplasmic component|uniref:Ribose transport system substrate-binding protein n=1 Tax=Chelatococcus composti TaxID=1743235 RepID=A0A841KA55_9HYPH|nr:ABC transporter substrate-binding protein [Chelatococcus composti]MBB6168322.1 ribose transport system substrate-binding protein [Chelatococcus composti]MBS7736595.1 ABC transporter substrate-binding protein [Chelatococcus composti]PZN40859.1 MAG: ABC transporter substrate-binding protein [Pseudomonadota bacterium]GGG39155.1 ABC transporter substrate-binding protein [Chelatococcus composti]